MIKQIRKTRKNESRENKRCRRRNMKLEKRVHKLFEGAGAGVEINAQEFNGKLVSVEDGGKDCDCILHLENCSMLGSTVSTYYWGSPDWMDGDFKNGKVDLKVNFYEEDENDIDDIINSFKLGQTISIDDLKISHGSGWSHVSLDGECEGRSDDTFRVFDKDGYYVNCEIQSIIFDFGDQIEYFYQDAEQYWLDEENENEEDDEEFESVRHRRYLRRVIENRRTKVKSCRKINRHYTEAKSGVDAHTFDMSLMSLGNLLDSLDSVCRNEPQVPRYVWKCMDAGEALANGIDFVLRANKKDLQKTMSDKRLSDFRPSFAIFAKEAENIRREIDNPDGDYWSLSHDLRNFKEELEEVTSVLNAVL